MFANWPAYIDLAGAAGDDRHLRAGLVADPRGLQEAVRRRGRLRGEDRRQRRRSSRRSSRPSSAASPTGWDLMVLTDWMAAKIISQGLGREDRPVRRCPNCVANLARPAQGPALGPEQRLPLPVAVGHDRRRLQRQDARREQASRSRPRLADLWAIPADKLTFLTEARDTFGLGLLKLGIDPEPGRPSRTTTSKVGTTTSSRSSTRACGSPATSTSRTSPQKKVWAAMVWSGDLASSGGEDDRLHLPRGGRDDLDRQHAHPEGRGQQVHGRADDELRVRPQGRRPDRRTTSTTSRRSRARPSRSRRSTQSAATNPLLFPPTEASSPSSTTSSS